ncbi:hypothetical protein [Terriglobus saanensis]|uniref:Uncharacterized protein n=1 Tax=Terriglobus saanensis (strain ATCC BAA-1853 / DSM 23119 / SP1PR4) TaxID=401053 RepID=E8V327_TERSS|nr:hypothetical protein [Terriglobus saanensis]ADV81302.1 hypothetical protein AciPR4_0467 [Terriglobus saanensis SP1PR4]
MRFDKPPRPVIATVAPPGKNPQQRQHQSFDQTMTMAPHQTEISAVPAKQFLAHK